MGARLIGELPRLLRHPIRIEDARPILRRRLERRAADLLDLVQWGVYANPASPYRALLRVAGCEYGDLDRLVATEGLEGALGQLYAQGVYLTVEELKGRRATVRGSTAIQIGPSGLFSPRLAPHLLSQTSGSRGSRSVIPISLPAIVDRAVDLAVILALTGRAIGAWPAGECPAAARSLRCWNTVRPASRPGAGSRSSIPGPRAFTPVSLERPRAPAGPAAGGRAAAAGPGPRDAGPSASDPSLDGGDPRTRRDPSCHELSERGGAALPDGHGDRHGPQPGRVHERRRADDGGTPGRHREHGAG